MCSGGLSAHRFKDVDGLLHTGFHLALDRLPFGCEGVLAALCNLVEEIGQAVRVVNAGGLAPAVDGAEVIHAVVKQDIEHLASEVEASVDNGTEVTEKLEKALISIIRSI